ATLAVRPDTGLKNPSQPPPPDVSKPVRYPSRSVAGISQPLASDAIAPAVPLALSDSPGFSGGGLPGRIAALAGIDLQDPMQLAPPPTQDGLHGFYRDDLLQPWQDRR